jgi:glycosyltransferase involved in cell wall biosynthesis
MAHTFKKPKKPIESLLERLEKFKKLNIKAEKKHWSSRGFQVVISAYNAEPYLSKALLSIERCMSGQNWVLLFGNDACEDSTMEIVNDFRSYCSASVFEAHSFKKAKNVAQAKNRIIKQINDYRDKYPAILLCDADDIVCEDRAEGLLNEAFEKNSKFMVGDWIEEHEGEEKEVYHEAIRNTKTIKFGPWSTLIHESLIPEDGLFFYEGIDAHEDLLLWYELKKAEVKMGSANGVLSCRYIRRIGSVSCPKDKGKKNKIWEDYTRLRGEVYKL